MPPATNLSGNTHGDSATILEIFCQLMYLMGLFYHRTVFNHPVVKELFHDIQLAAGIRNSILSLKSIPHFLAIREPDICIHKVFSENTYDAASKNAIGTYPIPLE
jgi:hypothetical protein